MRFLILSQYFSPEVGATQVRLSAFCRELVRAGHQVEVVTAMPHHPVGRIFPHYRGKFYRREFEQGITIHRVWLWCGAGRSSLWRVTSYLSFMLTAMFGLLKAKKPDFVFADSPPLFLGMTGRIAASLWRCPFIFNVADLWPDSVRDLGIMRDGFFMRLAERLEKWTYLNADYVTAVTGGIRETLLTRKGVPPAKLLFLPNGVDTQLFQPCAADELLKSKLGLSGKRVVIYAGNHGYAAGADQILYAAELLRQETSVHFLFVGDGPEKPKLQKLAQDQSLRNVSFLDSVPLNELPSLLSFAEIAVITLRRSGVMRGARPAKAFVMMAAGKPIVLAAEGEAEKLVRSAGAGLVVLQDQPRKLAAAILRLLSDPLLARKMGERGRQFVLEHFEWSHLVQTWLNQLAEKSQSDTPSASIHEPTVVKSESQANQAETATVAT